MPELPEVETISRGLQNLCGKKIKNVFRSPKRLRIDSTIDLFKLKNSKIKKIHRRARYILIDFDNNHSLIIHLGMSGRLTISKSDGYVIKKHDHFICEFNNGNSLIFNDPRRFGFVDLIQSKNIKTHKMLAKLGLEPLSEEFDAKYLMQKLCGKKMNIKTTMMDNEIVVGVGNIYISESLFVSAISPLRIALSLKIGEVNKLVLAIKKTLENAIEHGGSSISDYVNSEGNRGNFQNNFKVYGQAGKKCLHCKTIITKIVLNGRSSLYCKNCQK
jgi:formamidopyrimidine-DNA glycosylase